MLTDDYFGWDFYDDDNAPLDTVGHGTKVAGVVAAEGNNSTGLTGISWRSKFLPVRIGGSGGPDAAAIVDAIEYVTDLKNAGVNVRVINTSYESTSTIAGEQAAIEGARDAGILFIAAAGNSGIDIDSTPRYPAAYNVDNIISVAATDDDDQLASFSNYGDTNVDLAAPGDNIRLTSWDPLQPNDNSVYDFADGTSFASPMVSGVAALAFSMKPDLKYYEVRDLILDNVDVLGSLNGLVATGGRLNAHNVVSAIDADHTGDWQYTFIGDHEGAKDVDDVWVRVKPGDSSKVQVMEKISGTYTLVKTLDNVAWDEIGIFTLAGADVVTVDAGVANRVYVAAGMHADSVIGGDSEDTLRGETGNDTLKGGAGADLIYGQNGNDLLHGNSGADIIDGGGGTDTFSGGNGADTLYADDGEADSGSGDADTDVLDVDGFDTITQ